MSSMVTALESGLIPGWGHVGTNSCSSSCKGVKPSLLPPGLCKSGVKGESSSCWYWVLGFFVATIFPMGSAGSPGCAPCESAVRTREKLKNQSASKNP